MQWMASAHVKHSTWKAASAGGAPRSASTATRKLSASKSLSCWGQARDHSSAAACQIHVSYKFKFFPPHPLIATQRRPINELASFTGGRSAAAVHLCLNATESCPQRHSCTHHIQDQMIQTQLAT